MTFSTFQLDQRIARGVQAAGFVEPTPIQTEAIPVALEGKDILGVAQTGTGKTAAFVLPILQRLSTGPLRQVRCLILSPTRELAQQIHEDFQKLGAHLRVRSLPIYGGVSKNRQIDQLASHPEIIVACPGRLLDHLGDGTLDLSKVEILVLDEADRMCDMGFLPDVRRILRQLPKERQTLFFSATMPAEIRQLSRQMLRDPITVQVGEIAPASTVSHALYPIPKRRKRALLLTLLERTATGRVLVFTRTKYGAKNLARTLVKAGYRAVALQGNMSQNRRLEAMNGFRGGKYDIMVATDVAARGIDVSDISHVINFDMPNTADAYTHRIGRTGRAEQTGEAWSFCTDEDRPTIRQVERLLDQRIEVRRLDDFDYTAPPEPQPSRRPSNNRRRSRSSRQRSPRR